MSVLVYDAPGAVTLERLEDELARAFTVVRAALLRGDAVVVVLGERDVQAVGEPAAAALAHGLLGLVRALATEGAKPGWRVNALSAPAGLAPEERLLWIERLAEPGAANGVLVRLGGDHLGRVAA